MVGTNGFMSIAQVNADSPTPRSFRDRLKEISMFFDESDSVHQAMRRISEKLEAAGVDYAIVGGMAVNAHRHARTTKDVDFLLTSAALATFLQRFVPGDFLPVSGHSRRFIDRTTGVAFDILVTGMFPGSGKPGPVSYPNPEDVAETIDAFRIVNLPSLVELKLAAGRFKDFGDVVELIRAHDLNEGFAAKLNASVHGDFIECLEEKRREDEYEVRQDEAFERKREES